MEPANFAVMIPALAPGDRPLATRLHEALRHLIRRGQLVDGQKLPSTRQAARQLGVSRNTVIAAYDLLAAEGLIRQAARQVPVVTAESRILPATDAPRLSLSQRGQTLMQDRPRSHGMLCPGRPDPALFPADLWARALRRVARQPPGPASLYEQYNGLLALRAALADHWLRHIGMSVSPDQIVIIPTTQASLSLLARMLCDPGDRALVELPGYGGALQAWRQAGLCVAPLPVGADGAIFSGIGPARLAYLSPAAQYPTGIRMSLARRQAALDWAKTTGGVLVCDEYDGEFLWHGARLPSLAAMSDGAAVITLGSVAKALLPGLRLGWMVVPETLAAQFGAAQRNLGLAANIHAQAALASLLSEGALRVHLRHAAKTYAMRREALLAAIRGALGDNAAPYVPDGGLQLVLPLADAIQERHCAEAAWRAGFGPALLSQCCGHGGIDDHRFGLIIGFADADAKRAAGLAAVIAAA